MEVLFAAHLHWFETVCLTVTTFLLKYFVKGQGTWRGCASGARPYTGDLNTLKVNFLFAKENSHQLPVALGDNPFFK